MSDFGVELERWTIARQIGVRELAKLAGHSSQLPSGKSRPSPAAAEVSAMRSRPEANCGPRPGRLHFPDGPAVRALALDKEISGRASVEVVPKRSMASVSIFAAVNACTSVDRIPG